MKNLKKVLALVLVFASLLGLATMASATKSDDYSDAASISHLEAVDVMSTIGVFDGISGAFSGDSILTREQAAKIITYMVLGKNQADALVASVAPYTDVARDRWSAGSIAYCKNEGILAGVGNGRFDPNGKLTGVAFAKMCLVALGYDPDVEGLTGSDWAVNTSKLAIAGAKITSSLSQPSLADEMSREDACQMAFNTLQATMVDYDTRGTSITINGATITTGSSKAKPVAQETNWAGLKGIGYDGADDGIQQFTEKYFSNLRKTFSTDSFGRPSNVWTYKSEDIGTYNKNNWLVKDWTAKVSKSEMYNAIGSSVYNRLKNDEAKLRSYADGCYVTEDDTAAWKNSAGQNEIAWYFDKSSSKAAGNGAGTKLNSESGNGVKTELYMNDDGDVWVVMVNTYLVKANADYNTTKESVSVDPIAFDDDTLPGGVGTGFLPTEISADDFDVSGIKEGDYLLITVSGADPDNNESTLESVAVTTPQKGTVTEYTYETNVVMGGTTYSYNKILAKEKKQTNFSINSEATLVLDEYGYIMCVDDSIDSNKFVYIGSKGAFGLGTKVTADAYFTDGTNEEITVTKYNTHTTASAINGNLTAYGWYTFTGTTGGQYTLKDINTTDYTVRPLISGWSSGQELIKSGTVKFMDKVKTDAYFASLSNVRGSDKTIFIIKDKDGANAYTGIANVPNVTLSNTPGAYAIVHVVEKNSDGFAKYVFVDVSDDVNADVDEGTSAADYMFVLKTTTNTTYADGMEYQKCTVVIDGKTEERWVSTSWSVQEGRLYYSVKEDSNGRLKGGKEVGKQGSNARRFMAAMCETAADVTTYKSSYEEAGNEYGVSYDCQITRSGSTLTIPALENAYSIKGDTDINKSDLVTNSKSNINLVIGKGCDLLKDDDSDYETYLNTSINQVTGLLGKNGLVGRVYLVVTEDDGDVVDSLWIYVDRIYDIP